MKDNVIKVKSFAMAIRIINLYKFLKENKQEYVLSKQLLRSGTSIGANVREGLNAESKKGFIHKLAIAQKETDETLYWIELLKETEFITEMEFNSLNNDLNEILKIIRSIIITAKNNIAKQ